MAPVEPPSLGRGGSAGASSCAWRLPRQLDRAVQDIADTRGWRRGNVGDVLVTLVDLLLDDAELQRRVAAAVPVPKRVKYVR